MPTRKDQSLGDPEFYQAKKELKKRFNIVLTNLQKTVEKNGYAVRVVQRFRDCLENPDVTQLPFYSPLAASHHHNKIDCVLSLLSCTVQMYWTFYVKDSKIEAQLDNYLSTLETIAEKELSNFKIVGTKYPKGYYLEENKNL